MINKDSYDRARLEIIIGKCATLLQNCPPANQHIRKEILGLLKHILNESQKQFPKEEGGGAPSKLEEVKEIFKGNLKFFLDYKVIFGQGQKNKEVISQGNGFLCNYINLIK